MDTYFAPAAKASQTELLFEIDLVSQNAIMSGLLHTINGVLAILNEQRQLVAINDSFLQMLGIDDAQECLGMRPGQVLQCIHAHDEPSGCGTTSYCSSCGAAVAMVSSLEQDKPIERICALTANRGGKMVDIALHVRSHPLEINKKRFLLLFLQDITQQQQWAALERTFFHDINNMLSALVMASQLLVEETPSDLARTFRDSAQRLHREIAIQQYLAQSESRSYQPMWQKIEAEWILGDLGSFFATHPAARNKKLDIAETSVDIAITTDISLLLRVLCNMIINALEATEKDGVVKVWLEQPGNALVFCVWNAQEIPPHVAKRIFQRNYSTKQQAGRGVGTFSMKLFGEQILGGQVNFVTSGDQGTIFRFTHPL